MSVPLPCSRISPSYQPSKWKVGGRRFGRQEGLWHTCTCMHRAAQDWRCCCLEASRRGFGRRMLWSSRCSGAASVAALGLAAAVPELGRGEPRGSQLVIGSDLWESGELRRLCSSPQVQRREACLCFPALGHRRTWDLGYFPLCWLHSVAFPLGFIARKPWVVSAPIMGTLSRGTLDATALVTHAEGSSTHPFASPVAIFPKVFPCRLSPLRVALGMLLGCLSSCEPPWAKTVPAGRLARQGWAITGDIETSPLQ